MTKRLWPWLITTWSVATFALGCGGDPSENGRASCPERSAQPSETNQASVSSPARIFLTTELTERLVQRAQAGDAAWTELRAQCDAYAGATVNPPSGAAYPTPPNVGQGYQGEGYLPAMTSLGLC